MLPQLVTVRVRRPRGRTIRVWVPLLPFVLPLLPVVALAAVVACLLHHVSVPRALVRGWRFVSALPGTRFDIEQGGTAVLITIK
ncbi:hypothetical protein [Umezawaea sp.]|uniref:hypothetical protein n=1 Tax=Umezawaea sp. TaxID=1955258 RepID=UPI002ED36849